MELDAVGALAQQLRLHLQNDATAIASLHRHGAQSKAIQDRVGSLLEEQLGFQSEVVVTPDEGLVTQARPDFYFPLSDRTGVIAEVERGGTTANNHDLKDLWKTHLAVNANHLFLVVPNQLFKESGAVREKALSQGGSPDERLLRDTAVPRRCPERPHLRVLTPRGGLADRHFGGSDLA
ncbi:hypothetical protein [Knoellia sp. Soil729]|uniref:hypothetical protein n=1 Tax=Knoellia sp. Soil729 TaxID=1736394 RepID=UPI0012E8086F|nr:hypothetical protein [Knoellia sp. Soil729]